jgi:recombination protein RecA
VRWILADGPQNVHDLVDLAQKYMQSGKKDLGASLPSLASEYNTGGIRAWIPSGNTIIDAILGGGLPLGRISELYSVHTSEGKTTMAIQFATQVQKAGGLVIWMESEAAMDWPRAERMGMDLSKTMVWGPPHLEGGFDYLNTTLDNIQGGSEELQSKPVLVIWDTISFCPSAAEASNDFYSEGMMSKPRTLKRLLTKMLNKLFSLKAHLLLISQSYTSPTRFGSSIETSGGGAPKQVSSIRIQLRRMEKSSEADKETFIKTMVTTVKNKVAVPFREAPVQIDALTGYNDILSLATYFDDNHLEDYVKSGGGWYTLSDGKTATKKCRWAEVENVVKERPELLEAWRKKVFEVWPLPPDRQRDPETGWILPVGKDGKFIK